MERLAVATRAFFASASGGGTGGVALDVKCDDLNGEEKMQQHEMPNTKNDDGVTILLPTIVACSLPCLEVLIEMKVVAAKMKVVVAASKEKVQQDEPKAAISDVKCDNPKEEGNVQQTKSCCLRCEM
ncbi:hypothetical protein Zm00014a_007189 [Zea mays]|uniref:Uncharacterized protein n=3 Tax=Zea mays TaxID=4577 RepID=A0A3L6EAI5_MAIZE|nr:hypothetical protein Zm00014a_007189 [Zea mays]